MSNKTAIIIGSSGVIGSRCLQKLLNNPNFNSVTTLVRRSVRLRFQKHIEHIVDFNNIDSFAHLVKADVVFACLGTTMKQAGSREAFYEVDYTYTLKMAELAAKNGCEQFLVISSLGADPNSSVYYSRVKGEMEEALKKIPIPYIGVFRPSLLISVRKEFRRMEKFGIFLMRYFLNFFLWGPLRKYRGIKASDVARAMVKVALENRTGYDVIQSDEIQELSQK